MSRFIIVVLDSIEWCSISIDLVQEKYHKGIAP